MIFLLNYETFILYLALDKAKRKKADIAYQRKLELDRISNAK